MRARMQSFQFLGRRVTKNKGRDVEGVSSELALSKSPLSPGDFLEEDFDKNEY
jgi:hypothetical protein